MKKILIALFIVTTLSACTSRSAAENSCRFAQGVYDSKTADEQRIGSDLRREEADNAQHILSGLFEILNGSLREDDECSSK